MQLGDERRLADARVARHEHELGPALRDHALERGEQRLDLALAAVEPLRDLEPVGEIALAEREGLDGAARPPPGEALVEVVPQAERALVALLGGLGEQLEHDRGQERGNRGDERVRRERRLGDVAVHPLDGIAGLEGQGARQHLVEGDAEGVEVGPLVDPAVHPARLLRAPCTPASPR